MRLLAEAIGFVILAGVLIYGAKMLINKAFKKQDPSNPEQE